MISARKFERPPRSSAQDKADGQTNEAKKFLVEAKKNEIRAEARSTAENP
jgi:hypothetical protein